jgi:alpha-aminoadipate carrier protein LysW
MPKTCCPDCGEIISVNNPQEGAMITCHDCGTELEIISTDPFEVDFPLEYDDGWDDDEGEEE